MAVTQGAMRVGVDARAVYSPRRRGTGKNLVDVYQTMALRRPHWHFAMFDAGIGQDDPFVDLPNVERVTVNIPGYRWNLWQDIRLPISARWRDVDVLHCPANVAPYWQPSRLLLTIHDLIQLETPTDGGAPEWWSKRIRRSAVRATRIVVPSQFTATQVSERFGVPPEKITVNYWAPDRGCQRVESGEQIAAVIARYGVQPGQRYVLVFGAEDPRKNTKTILQAWAQAQPRLDSDVVMLVIGLQPQALEWFKSLQLTPPGSTLLHGFADEADIPALLTGALALCYASLAEGFGLPLLDAFRCGAPVITSSTTSLPEVAGNAARFVNPKSAASIAEGLLAVMTSPSLQEELVTAGFRRLNAFSWEKCADTLADALEASAR